MKLKPICSILAAVLLGTLLYIPIHSFAAEAAQQKSEQSVNSADQAKGSMQVSQSLVDVLKKLEGFSRKPYWDYQQWTVGYGTRCPDDKLEEYKKNGISDEEAEDLLFQELRSFENAVNRYAAKNNVTFKQNEFDALVSFSYNVGAGWSTDTDGTLYKLIAAGDHGPKLVHRMSLYCRAGSEYILIHRRMAEIQMYLDGIYDTDYADHFRYVFLSGAGGNVDYRPHGFDTRRPTPVLAEISAPDGKDENGHRVTYVFDGWYTQRAGGEKVEQLDDRIAKGTVLYAHWKTPSGKPVIIPEPDEGTAVKVTVQTSALNIRSGPQMYYAILETVPRGTELTVTKTITNGSKLWGQTERGWACLKDGGTLYTDYTAQVDNLLPQYGTVTEDYVNVRTGPGTGYGKEGQKMSGDRVRITEWKSDYAPGVKGHDYETAMMWGKIENGWICMRYVALDNKDGAAKVVTGLKVKDLPANLKYAQHTEMPDLTGGTLSVTYSTGETEVVEMKPEMVVEFDSSKAGKTQVTLQLDSKKVSFEVEIVSGIFGDINGDGEVTDRDAVQLLRHVLFPDLYQIQGFADFDKDGNVTDRDAVLLLRHVLFPDLYPLN